MNGNAAMDQAFFKEILSLYFVDVSNDRGHCRQNSSLAELKTGENFWKYGVFVDEIRYKFKCKLLTYFKSLDAIYIYMCIYI